MKKIQDFDWGYFSLHFYVHFAIRCYYGKICTSGTENIPTDKAVILAPNHQNALMDALAILLTRSGQPVFLARADIFKKKSVANILNFLNILPVYRIRDGRDELDKNQEIFEKSVDVLRDDVELCLMPEGKQSFKRTLLPLVKGMFRIAFKAQDELKDKEVVIVPVGIDYEDYVNPGKDWIIRFGKAIEVGAYTKIHDENPNKALNTLRDDVYEGISGLIQNIQSKEYYDLFYQISLLADSDYCKAKNQPETLPNLLDARRKISIFLDDNEKNNPDIISKLSFDYKQYTKKLKTLGIKDEAVEKPQFFIQLIARFLGLLLGFPFFISGLIANFIPAFTPYLITNKFKQDDFKSSVGFVLWLVLFPVYYLLVFIIVGVLHSWICALTSVLGSAILGYFAFKYGKYAKRFGHYFRYFVVSKQKRNQVSEIKKLRKSLISLSFRA